MGPIPRFPGPFAVPSTIVRSVSPPPSSARYVRAVVLSAGAATISLLAAVMLVRGVDRVEVIAAVMYVGVFLGIVALDVIGGLVAALAATAIYLLLRFDAIEVLGTSHFASLVLIRLLGYVAFGLIGGLSWQLLRTRLEKMESFDQVDDATLLLNARGFADLVDREMARARRSKAPFTVASVEFPASVLLAVPRKRRRMVLRDLGVTIDEGTRSADQVGVTLDRDRFRVSVFLPETDEAGARLVCARLIDRLSSHLLTEGAPLPRDVEDHVYSFPADAVEMGAMRDGLTQISKEQFPQADQR